MNIHVHAKHVCQWCKYVDVFTLKIGVVGWSEGAG